MIYLATVQNMILDLAALWRLECAGLTDIPKQAT